MKVVPHRLFKWEGMHEYNRMDSVVGPLGFLVVLFVLESTQPRGNLVSLAHTTLITVVVDFEILRRV
jgi:hypothetical protein